jgi:8-oxo-dGTP diphosphatase
MCPSRRVASGRDGRVGEVVNVGTRLRRVTERFRVVPAAYIFLRRGDEVLLQLRQNTGYMDGYWAAAAAGHVEPDESVFEAAVREASEELDIAIAVADLLPLCGMHRTHRNHLPIDERVDFFFSCRTWAGEPRLVESDKAADLQWCALADLPSNVVPHERSVLDTLLSGGPPAVVSFGFD